LALVETQRMNTTRVTSSEYMVWAKTRSQATFNLANSGVAAYSLADLPVTINDLEINGPSWYGYEPLQQALASKFGVDASCVVAANGTSMANFLALAGTLETGDEVLVEYPTYELLVDAARYLGAEVKRFSRPFAVEFRLDPEVIARAVTSRTRLIVITNLNNPSSALADEDTLRAIGEIARSVDARVLVDEVYLEAMFEHAPPSAFHLGNEFVVTGSLTKAYGLSGLRCGWILAEPELAQRIWRLNDLMANIPAHAAERLSCIALANLDRIAARARRLLDANRIVLNRFLDKREDLEVARFAFGTVSFPRLKEGNVDDLCRILREKHDTTVVPGRFFEMPDHFRIGLGCDTEVFEEGIARLTKALDEIISMRH
jgi:aspartate/methionine/tyrosine aminotransferase